MVEVDLALLFSSFNTYWSYILLYSVCVSREIFKRISSRAVNVNIQTVECPVQSQVAEHSFPTARNNTPGRTSARHRHPSPPVPMSDKHSYVVDDTSTTGAHECRNSS